MGGEKEGENENDTASDEINPSEDLTFKEKLAEAMKEALSRWPGRTWSRRYSIHRGTMFKLDDEMITVNRGGTKMTMVKTTAFGVPPIVIGHNLDDEGSEAVDKMLSSPNMTVEETAQWAIDYVPGETNLVFGKGGHCPRNQNLNQNQSLKSLGETQ